MIDATKNTVVQITLSYDTATGAFEARSNSLNQITTRGMLSMGVDALVKAKEAAPAIARPTQAQTEAVAKV